MSHGSLITRIESARLLGQRPRPNGSNARLGAHGREIYAIITRITLRDGATGFGWSRIAEEDARRFLGLSIADLFTDDVNGRPSIGQGYRRIEYPLYDLAAKQADVPVYRFLDPEIEAGAPFRAGCYDTSLYIDDLEITDDREAAALIAGEAADGYARGHRAFKIKVGRGAMHMDVEAGTRRDIEIIRAVRAEVGGAAKIMIDANNGYTLNLTKRVLAETAEEDIYWIEEAFHEDQVLYRNLKEWMETRGMKTLVADGEGDASPRIEEWARDGLVDILQYDIRNPGFGFWLEKGPAYDRFGIRSAPHHYGGYFCNYAAGHLKAAIDGLEMIEWDESEVAGLDAPGYTISDGMLTIPDSAGFGMELDEKDFQTAIQNGGYCIEED